jgi:uncharacterized membrane protein SpoIIM required for sporulation
LLKAFFTESLNTISEAKHCIFLAVLLYGFSAVAGWWYADSFLLLEEQIMRLAAQFAGKDAITFIFKIFVHNLIATYVTMCLVVLFGIVPLVVAVINGLVLGWIIAKSSAMSGVNLPLMLIPHGIFEWPAMLIAWGVGLWRGVGYRFSEVSGSWRQRWEKAHKIFFTVILPLLLIAAVIEGRYHIINEISAKISN